MAVKEVSPGFPAGIPQNVPEKVMSGVAEVSLDLRLEIGIIQKLGSGFVPIWSILIQFPHTGIMESEEKILRTAFFEDDSYAPKAFEQEGVVLK